MTRRPDWQARLDSFLREHQQHPFAYGSWDCCLWVCRAISVMTDIDPARSFRNHYNSRDEALSLIEAATGTTSVRAIVERVTAELWMPEVPVLFAQRGDVLLLKRARDYSLGLVAMNGREAIVARARGLCCVPLSRALRAWRV
jgi:hypothetical protein